MKRRDAILEHTVTLANGSIITLREWGKPTDQLTVAELNNTNCDFAKWGARQRKVTTLGKINHYLNGWRKRCSIFDNEEV